MRRITILLLVLLAALPALALQKNVASQKAYLYCYTAATGVGLANDEANWTVYISKDGADGVAATNAPADVVNQAGMYVLALETAETNADCVIIHATTTTATALIEPVVLYTGAAVPAVNVTQWNTAAVATPTNAGVPEVDLTHVKGTELPAEGTGGDMAKALGKFLNVAVDSQRLTVASYNQGADSNTILSGITNASLAKLDDMLDGTGAALYLSQLRVNSTAAGGAIDIDNTTGPAISARSTGDDSVYIDSTAGFGIYATTSSAGAAGICGEATGGTGYGLWFIGPSAGARLSGSVGGNGDGLQAVGAGTGFDINADIHGTVDTVTTLTNAPTGMALEATLTAMKGATFDTVTDSLEAIRNRGDAAWVTGAGGDPWATALPGAYVEGTAGYLLGNAYALLTNATYGLSALRTRGDIAWITASGFPAGADWTQARAIKVDRLDAAISTRATPADVKVIIGP